MTGRAGARSWVAAGALVAVATLGACADIESAEEEGYHPAEIEEIPGSDVQRVTLTEDAASRISLEIEPVSAEGGTTTVPYAALVYDGEGGSWVYVEDGALSFVRRAVDVRRVDGDRVVVDDVVTTTDRVATIGATEIYGAELGIDGSH